jgi:hypothetical protein
MSRHSNPKCMVKRSNAHSIYCSGHWISIRWKHARDLFKAMITVYSVSVHLRIKSRDRCTFTTNFAVAIECNKSSLWTPINGN